MKMKGLELIQDEFSKFSKEIYNNCKPILILSSVFGSVLVSGLIIRRIYVNEINGQANEKIKKKNKKKTNLESADLNRILNQTLFKELFHNVSIDRIYLRPHFFKSKSKRRLNRSLSLKSQYPYQEALQIDNKRIISSNQLMKRGLKILENVKSRNEDVQISNEFDEIIQNTRSLIDKIQGLAEQIENEHRNLVKQSEEENQSITNEELDSDQHDLDDLEFYDAEEPSKPSHPKLYTDSLKKINRLYLPRTNLSKKIHCEPNEFYAKVECLRDGFNQIFVDKENLKYFVQIGEFLIKVLVTSTKDQQKCLDVYREMIDFLTNPDNCETIEQELKLRAIPIFNFYDLVLDYIILDFFQNVELVSTWMSEIVSVSWLGLDNSKEKRVKDFYHYSFSNRRKLLVYDGLFDNLDYQNGFFNRLYNLLEILMPVFALGFFGSDKDLKRKCNLVKQTIIETYRKLFDSNCVGYTNLDNIKTDMLAVFVKQFEKLSHQLQTKV